jgi:hypothetical protein
LEIDQTSPADRTLFLESRAENEERTLPEETTIEISSLNETLTKNPLTYQGTLNHAPVKILIDSGAMGNFVSKQAADRFSFSLHHVSNIPIVFANGAIGTCNKAASAACLRF